jgi:hypothetical protein
MNQIERSGLLTFAILAAVGDVSFAMSRCSFSPEIHVSALGLGALLQTTSVAIPLVVNRYLADRTPRYRLRFLILGALVCFWSLPVMETAVLYGDSVGKEKGFRSVGFQCTNHTRWFPDGT